MAVIRTICTFLFVVKMIAKEKIRSSKKRLNLNMLGMSKCMGFILKSISCGFG
jgi:hypothetical protein